MYLSGINSLIFSVLLHLVYGLSGGFLGNLLDLWNFFTTDVIIRDKNSNTGKNILIYNWRDIRHIWSGGAELYIHEIAKRLTAEGHQVFVFCGNDGKSKSIENIDGVTIIRKGGFFTVYIWAFIYYLFRFKGKFDVIIDSENGIPFFTPIYAGIPIICLIHHVHQDIFRNNLGFPLSSIASILEGKVMPFLYRNKRIVTVSASSKEDLEKLGLGIKAKIDIIHPGVNIKEYLPQEKTPFPSLIYLGRLKPYKTVETAIYALAHLIQKIPEIELVIAGEGESRRELERLSKNLHLEKNIKFTGKISEKEKNSLLARSWVMIQPSSMEGFGISAIEANAAGTPVVAANVPGLRNSVKNPHSGILVPWGNPSKFAEKIELIISNDKFRSELETGAREWALNFSWERSANEFLKIISEETRAVVPDYKCRFCQRKLKYIFADLGKSPISNDFVSQGNRETPDIFYPLCVYVCDHCLLVQIPNVISREKIFNNDYAYFSSYSESWLLHCKNFSDEITKKLGLNETSSVVELASNDGYLLQYFADKKIPNMGIEPCGNVAEIARKKGIETIVEFFVTELAKKLTQKRKNADLIIANNVLAHVPDLNDFVSGIKILLKESGTATLEFPHLLNLIRENQFDTIYHEHYSYFSLTSVINIFSDHNLTIYDVDQMPTHGGSLRIYVRHSQNNKLKVSDTVLTLTEYEKKEGLLDINYYTQFQNKLTETKNSLLKFLTEAKQSGKTVAAYGAPAKGNTLLNYCGIKSDSIKFTVDRSPYKQNHLLPGSRIPVYSPDKLTEFNPDYIIILPWNLKKEIVQQLKSYDDLNSTLIIPIP